jgi:tetratricopeptide (TPR) repeat protein
MRLAVLLAVVLFGASLGWAAPPNARAIAAEQAEAGRTAFARGDLDEAQRRFQEAFATFASPSYLLDIAEVQLKMQRRDRAIESMKSFLKLAASDPTQSELAQHVRMRLAELEKRGAPPLTPSPGPIEPVDEPGPEGVRAAVDSRSSGRRPFVDAIDDSTRAPVVKAIDDRPESPPRIELAAPAPARAPRRVLKPWETGLVALGVVAGLVLTLAPIVYVAAPPLHPDVFSPSFNFGVTR